MLTQFWACNPGRPGGASAISSPTSATGSSFRSSPAISASGCSWSAPPVLFHITTADGLIAFCENGHGPLAALPLGVQMLIFLVDTYWLEWVSAARFHPINLFFGAVVADVVLLIAGISPNVFVVLGPITVAHSA